MMNKLKLNALALFLLGMMMNACAPEDLSVSEDAEVSITDPALMANNSFTKRTINSYPSHRQTKRLNFVRGAGGDVRRDEINTVDKMASLGAEKILFTYPLKRHNAIKSKTTNQIAKKMRDLINEALAKKKNAQVWILIGSTPAVYEKEDVEQKKNGKDVSPLPKKGTNRTQMIDNVVDWMGKMKKEINTNDIIWVGWQEPGHSLGIDPNKPDEYTNAEWNNLKYIDYWKAFTAKAKAAGHKVAGISAPSGGEKIFDFIASEAKSKNLKDQQFWTFQLYGAGGFGDSDGGIKEALKASKKYGKNLLVQRTLWLKELRRDMGLPSDEENGTTELGFNTSNGMTYYLNMDKQYQDIDEAKFSGYILGKQYVKETSMFYDVYEWLQKTPNHRRKLENLPAGVDGFVLAFEKNYRIALWNKNNKSYDLTLNLNTAKYGQNPRLSSIYMSNKTIKKTGNGLRYSLENKNITNIKLKKDDVILINLTER